MNEFCQAMTDYRKEQKKAQATENVSTLRKAGIVIKEQGKNIYRIETTKGVVMFYSALNKWQFDGRVFKGNAAKLVEWMVKTRVHEKKELVEAVETPI